MKFKGDIIITNPCYIIRKNSNDWDKCNFGDNIKVLGIKHYLCSNTLYGDWSYTTFNSDTKESLGKFCADAGMIAVFLLDEVLAYNPNFNWYISAPWTTTLVKDFNGDIKIEVVHSDQWANDEIRVIGKGNINFETHQTGL